MACRALSTVDTTGLSPTYTPAQNLFIGVAATDDGRVYASGGNADRLFRLSLVGPTLLHEDLTEAEPVPSTTSSMRRSATARPPYRWATASR